MKDPRRSHYDAGFACGCFAWREILGGFIGGDFIDEFQNDLLTIRSTREDDRIPPGGEFAKIARDSLGAVLIELGQYSPYNPDDPDDPAIQKYLKDRGNRNFGSHHSDAINRLRFGRFGFLSQRPREEFVR